MKQALPLAKFSLRRLFLLAALGILTVHSSQSLAANGFPTEGVYTGQFAKSDGTKTPLVLSLSYTGVEEGSPSDEVFPVKRKMQASFIIGEEGGPYNLSYVNYSFDTSKIELQYTRPSRNEPTLYFHGSWKEDDSISGSVTGLKDTIGAFSLKINLQAKMETQAILTGKYNGQAKYYRAPTAFLSIRIDSSPASLQNPADMELEFTSGHVGGAVINSLELSLNRIYIDYFRNTIRLMYQEGNSGTLIFDGVIKGDTITGTMNSSLQGRTGTFEVKRVDP